MNGIALHLSGPLKAEVERALADWGQGGKMERLWSGDASLWTGQDEAKCGVFLQITCDPPVQLPIPGRRDTFGVVEAAQARGDFEVLAARKRRALRVHLRGPLDAALRTLREAIERVV